MKKILIGAFIAIMTLGVNTTSEAAQYDNENYCCGNGYYSNGDCCDYYDDGYCRSNYRSDYGRGRHCC